MNRRATLAEPIIICDFWRNRRGEAVRIQICEYEGQTLIDCRVHFIGQDGKLTPTSKGLSLSINKLPELVTGLRKALAKAAALGLIKSERQPLLDALDEAER